MKRGDILILAPLPPFDKPRPALVVQALAFDDLENVTVHGITGDPDWSTPLLRLPIRPSATNGLRKPSEIMIDSIQTVPLQRIGGWIGTADADTMRQVDIALRLFLGLP